MNTHPVDAMTQHILNARKAERARCVAIVDEVVRKYIAMEPGTKLRLHEFISDLRNIKQRISGDA